MWEAKFSLGRRSQDSEENGVNRRWRAGGREKIVVYWPEVVEQAICKKTQMVVSEHLCCEVLNRGFHVNWLTVGLLVFVQYRSEIANSRTHLKTRWQKRSLRVGAFSQMHLVYSFFNNAFCLCYLFCHLQFVFFCTLSLWIEDRLAYKVILEMWLDSY